MKKVVLVAGGTGGHINAALALGDLFNEEGLKVEYFTGKRPLDYQLFHNHLNTNKKNDHVCHLSSRPLRSKNPLLILRNSFLNFCSFLYVFFLFIKERPMFTLGAGGYVCGPTLLAAYFLRVPVFIIEQNAVMGLTNRLLSHISSKIFVHFSETLGLSEKIKNKTVVVGNPTRQSIKPVPHKNFDGVLKVLVFGGSLGARQINEVIDILIYKLSDIKISIHHQRGASNHNKDSLLVKENIDYCGLKYIDDIQKEYEWCDVIISRAGASTISELSVIRKPVLIFPYPLATDNHQFYNAKNLKKEADFSVEILSPNISIEQATKETEDFLFKAYRQELEYSKKTSSGNDSCQKILREIKHYVGMA